MQAEFGHSQRPRALQVHRRSNCRSQTHIRGPKAHQHRVEGTAVESIVQTAHQVCDGFALSGLRPPDQQYQLIVGVVLTSMIRGLSLSFRWTSVHTSSTGTQYTSLVTEYLRNSRVANSIRRSSGACMVTQCRTASKIGELRVVVREVFSLTPADCSQRSPRNASDPYDGHRYT